MRMKFCLSALLLTAPATAQDAFFDGFDQLDSDRWYVSDGWSNGEHQSCIWSMNQVAVEEGELRLSLAAEERDDFALGCAELQTNARQGFGTFEARMAVPYTEGMNANMFTFIGGPQNKPHNEIDFEFISPRSPVLQTNFHTFEGGENTTDHDVPSDGAFRTYSFIWEPDRIRWFIDGTLIREETGGVLPDMPQKMYLSLWSTDLMVDWMGRFDPASAPQTLVVDWAAYTPAGEDCAFPESVLCRPDVPVN